MPPAIFQVMALLIGLGGLATAAFPEQMSRWRMRGPAGDATIEPSRMRLLMMRVFGLVVAGMAVLMAFGDPAMFV